MDKQISNTDKIFATGVFLQPVKCKINQIEQWRWVAVSFEDDSFFDGEVINPIEYADDINELIADFEEQKIYAIVEKRAPLRGGLWSTAGKKV